MPFLSESGKVIAVGSAVAATAVVGVLGLSTINANRANDMSSGTRQAQTTETIESETISISTPPRITDLSASGNQEALVRDGSVAGAPPTSTSLSPSALFGNFKPLSSLDIIAPNTVPITDSTDQSDVSVGLEDRGPALLFEESLFVPGGGRAGGAGTSRSFDYDPPVNTSAAQTGGSAIPVLPLDGGAPTQASTVSSHVATLATPSKPAALPSGTGGTNTGIGGSVGATTPPSKPSAAPSSGGATPSGTSACNETWCSAPYCYKHLGPPGPPGLHEGVQFCNAGYIQAGKVPVFIPDCGPQGAACNIALSVARGGDNLSCLVTACRGKNAIWDPLTKRCGCDDGKGMPAGGGNQQDGGLSENDVSDATSVLQDGAQDEHGDEGDGNGDGGRSDAVNREALTKAGITINKQENGPDGSTSLNGLTEQSTNKLISIRNASGDTGMTITGGSEAGHSTHTDSSGNSTQTVDLRYTAGSNLNKYIETGTRSGSSYYFSQSDGSWIRFYNEPGSTNSFGTQPRHWHVELDTKRRP